jgi:zinc ribbon protein
MSSVPCTNCGAEISPGTKFCRRCGQPSLDTASVSEATTRVFEATAERKVSPTESWNAQPTGPAYLSPSARAGAPTPPPQDATTKSLDSTGSQKQKIWLAVSIMALLIAVFVAVVVGTMLKVRNAVTTQAPPVVTRPETGLPAPPAPPAPPALPPIEEPPAAGTSVATSELMYPGAETVMDMKSSRDNFLELRSTDSLDKVVDWYTTKLKPSEVIKDGTRGTEAILRAGRTSVIISARDSGTDILIKQGVER